MPRPRTPRAKAAVLGSDKKHAERFDGRNEPVVLMSLGDPPNWVKETDSCKGRTAWAEFASTIPWLNHSHRIMVGGASNILGRLMAGQDIGVQANNLLRQYLGQMGATPADASKVGIKADGEKADPGEEFFN